MLNTAKLIGFVATIQPAKAKAFYQDQLGLQLVEESQFALVFVSGSGGGSNSLRVQKVQELITPPYTSLGNTLSLTEYAT